MFCGDINNFCIQELVSATDLHILNNDATRGSKRLDVICCTDPGFLINIETFKPTIDFDHLGLLAEYTAKKKTTRKTYFRDQQHKNQEKLSCVLSIANFSDVIYTEDMNLVVSSLMASLGNIYSLCCPLKRVTMSNKGPLLSVSVPRLVELLRKQKHAHLRRKRFEAAKHQEKSGKILLLILEVMPQKVASLGGNE